MAITLADDGRVAHPGFTRGFRRSGVLAWLLEYLQLILALGLALPLTVSAISASWQWFSAPFPGFLLMENAVIPTVSGYRWPAEKALLFHSQVVAVNGQAVRTSAEVYRYVAAQPTHTPITYTFRKGTEEFQRTVTSLPFTASDYVQVYVILLLIAVIALGSAVVVGYMQPQAAPGRLFTRMSLITCVWTSTAIFLHLPEHPWLTRVYFLAEVFYPASVIHLAMHFPVDRQFSGRRRLLPALPYAVSAVLAALVLRGFFSTPPVLWPLHTTYRYTAVSLLCFGIALLHGYWEDRTPNARLRVKAILPSFVACGTLMVFAFTNNSIAGGDFPMQLGVIFVPLIFLSVAYAIVKHDLFDIDRVVRQSFVYALVSIVVITAYGLVLAIPARYVPNFTGEGQAVLGMTFVLVLAFALDPLRRLMQTLVDRAFYRTRLDYRSTISQVSEVMTTLLDLGQVITQVTRVVGTAMHLKSTTVCLLDDSEHRLTLWSRGADGAQRGRAVGGGEAPLLALLDGFPKDVTTSAVLAAVADAEQRRELAAFFAGIGASVVLPLMVRGRATGVLLLGPKRSGQPFDSDDIHLLRTLANQTAIAVQNARSYQQLEVLSASLDEKVRLQTDALRVSNAQLTRAYDDLKSAQAQLVQSEKMASLGQLVAGVAHELNNPVSFVHGGLANLEEYLERIVAVLRAYEQVSIGDRAQAQAVQQAREQARLEYVLQETPALLRICEEGSERIKKIVGDLRVFARADQGERAPTDVAEGIDSTVRLLSDRITRRGIVVARHYEDVPRIEAQAGQLNQVWMNLLTNAADAVEERPDARIDVAVRKASLAGPPSTVPGATSGGGCTGWVEVEVRDNGVGIAAGDRERIFEPFFTTKPVGHGTGLGLSIVYGAVKSHGGTIAVDSKAGAGTCVIVRLPVSQTGDASPASDSALDERKL
jgi:signal transduction histidine kinase